MENNKKFEGVEALRGIAVLMTVFAHLPITTEPFIGSQIRSPWFMGVPIFFGISGWIIAHVTCNYVRKDIPKFLLKRFFRIAPVLVVTCIFSLLFSITLPHNEIVDQFYPDLQDIIRSITSNLLFISDFSSFLGVKVPLSLLGLWSISVEFKFYLLFAVVMVLPRSIRFFC
jgi:exopolysaccharide production protein ExoZ